MTDRVIYFLSKVPAGPTVIVILLALGWQFYGFNHDTDSELLQKRQQLESVNSEIKETQKKLKNMQDFLRTLENQKVELRKLALQLEETKAMVSEQMDYGLLMRLIDGEAKKVGLIVDGLKPGAESKFPYYVEQAFDLKFRGVYIQLQVFLEHLAALEKIIRVGDIMVKPITAANSRFVQLDGQMILNAYRYVGSDADTKGKENQSTESTTSGAAAAAASGASSGAAKTGGGP